MRDGAIIHGREGRRVYQNPFGHTSMPSIRIISMSTDSLVLFATCKSEGVRAAIRDLTLGIEAALYSTSLFHAYPYTTSRSRRFHMFRLTQEVDNDTVGNNENNLS